MVLQFTTAEDIALVMHEIKGNNKLTLFTLSMFKKFPRLFTIPCQWAIKACCAAVFVFEREDPFIMLALDVLGAWIDDDNSKYDAN